MLLQRVEMSLKMATAEKYFAAKFSQCAEVLCVLCELSLKVMFSSKMRIPTSDINYGPHIPIQITTKAYKTPNHILSKPDTLIKCFIFIHHSAPILPQALLTVSQLAHCTPLYAPPVMQMQPTT